MDELKIEYIKIDELTPYNNNTKVHTKKQIEHIANSIKKFGFNDPLGIYGRQNIVLEGNGRIEAARKLGMKELPCVRLDHLSPEEMRAYVIAHNSINLETGFDDKVLYDELKRLQNYDFREFGLTNTYIKALQTTQSEIYQDILAKNTRKLVRNSFKTTGKYDIPIIRKQSIDISALKSISFCHTRYDDNRSKQRMVHFFLHDYRFECVYENPDILLEKLKQYVCVLTPDFSLYMDMPISLQVYSIFKNRWCGAFWQSKGMTVIPTVSWSDERSFEFCFDGIERGSIVAVSTHGSRNAKEDFLRGYRELLKKIEPCSIICYGKPFAEMEGNVIAIPYNPREGCEV
ncbi:MAG: DUF4417 domain-containing protein [Roseburia sp.]|nr:DUF4417 domain-containing protein [Roseburia sp.]